MISDDDRRGIAALHAADIEATRTLDVTTLLSLWTPDGAGIGPGGAIVRGAEREQALRRAAEASRGHEVITYEQRFDDLEVAGDWAWELGTFESVTRDPDSGEVTRVAGPMLRILRRGDDGRWRFHRSMWVSRQEAGA